MFFKKNKLSVFIIFLFICILFGLNKTTSQRFGIDYVVSEYEIPLYLKLYNFYGRHLNYKFIVNNITKNSDSDIEKVFDISIWLSNNIKKIPKGVEVIDSHPLTIIDRRLGTKDQFADLLSVMLVYSGINSFNFVNNENAFTFFMLNDFWSVIDPYYGIIFLNTKGQMASIQELKDEDWELFTLGLQPINTQNFKSVFYNNFDNITQVKENYMNIFFQMPSQEKINRTNSFDLGGRSNTQSPLGRLKYILRSLQYEIFS